MEAELTEYAVAPDPTLWIEVPLRFPSAHWPDAEAWAEEVGRRVSEPMPEREKNAERITGTARIIADFDVPGAANRFWYFPLTGEFVAVAHLYLAPRKAFEGESLERVAGAEDESVTVPRVSEIASGVFGRIVQVLSTSTVIDPAGGEHVVGCARLAAERDGVLFLLEVIDERLGNIALLLGDLPGLLDSIELRMPA